jgi:ATP-dependent DNA helicase HFM1/MER3
VKLRKYVYGYESSGNDWRFDNSLDGKLPPLLAKHSENKPLLVFCFTKKSCERTALKLAKWWSTLSPQDRAWPAPSQRVSVIDHELQELVRCGIAFHHGGVEFQDRSSIEKAFLEKQIHVICCTSTLAIGVNLPCHTVVLKGTVRYGDDGLDEYSDLEIMQMLGRAGRPQFDKSAVAIIMTHQSKIEKYNKMISGEEKLESTLHLNLVEHLNSEIGLGTIKNVHAAKKWLEGTFLSVRMKSEPWHYVKDDVISKSDDPSTRIQEWCERDIELLQDYRLITNDEQFACTEYGNAMSKYMVQFGTMKLLLDIPPAPTMAMLVSNPFRATRKGSSLTVISSQQFARQQTSRKFG